MVWSIYYSSHPIFLFMEFFDFCLEEQALEHIFKVFKKNTVRYVCVTSDNDTNESMPRLNLQIILHGKKSIYTPFMDQFLGLFLTVQLIDYTEIHIQLFLSHRFKMWISSNQMGRCMEWISKKRLGLCCSTDCFHWQFWTTFVRVTFTYMYV